MKPENFTERRNRIIKFAGLYAASIIVLLFIFSAAGGHFASGNEAADKAGNGLVAAERELLHADSLLHAELHELQQSDARYALLPSSAGDDEKDKVSLAATLAESAINKSIDSIQQLANGYAAAVGTKYTGMLGSFRTVLKDRTILKSTQASIATGGTALPGKAQDVLQWKNELLIKELDVKRLQSEVKILQNEKLFPSKSSGVTEAQKGETQLLKTAFADQQKELDLLKEKYSRLKTDNSTMLSQMAEMKKPVVVPTASNGQTAESKAAENKINLLEQKVEGLNADLYFAKIDCNMARTDAQQMISNARQRKELLSESLVMLTNLSRSEDADIQRKAKEKIARLNRIASTLHD